MPLIVAPIMLYLIAERDPLNRFLAALLLHRAGYHTTKARDRREALMIVSEAAETGRNLLVNKIYGSSE